VLPSYSSTSRLSASVTETVVMPLTARGFCAGSSRAPRDLHRRTGLRAAEGVTTASGPAASGYTAAANAESKAIPTALHSGGLVLTSVESGSNPSFGPRFFVGTNVT
jgi:hypothetical protein